MLRRHLAVFCVIFVLSISLPSRTKTQSKTAAPRVVSYPSDVNPQYFPGGTFSDSSETDGAKDFTARWYSKHLRAMSEPSLSDASKGKTLVTYRFLWLRTFHHPIAIRLSIRPDGTGLLIGKMMSGQGGYEPGRLAQKSSVEVSEPEVQQFLSLLQRASFWTSKTEDSQPGTVGLDGAQWILEGVKGGTYHIVDGWSPGKDDYSRVCLYLLELSKITVPANGSIEFRSESSKKACPIRPGKPGTDRPLRNHYESLGLPL